MDQPQNELSRIVAIDDIGNAEISIEIDANDDERAVLARRFGLVAIDDLAAKVTVRRARNGGARVHARIVASVVQTCVVTLEPLTALVEDTVDVLFVPGDTDEKQEALVAVLGDDDPEPINGDVIDVGEVVAEYFGLALDVYPRQPEAVLANVLPATPTGESEPESPFAVLQDLKPTS